jgi:hypothetical protein
MSLKYLNILIADYELYTLESAVKGDRRPHNTETLAQTWMNKVCAYMSAQGLIAITPELTQRESSAIQEEASTLFKDYKRTVPEVWTEACLNFLYRHNYILIRELNTK